MPTVELETLVSVVEMSGPAMARLAMGAIGDIWPKAAAAVPALASALENREVLIEAAHALARIGVPAVPALVAALKGDPLQSCYVAQTLGQIGSAPEQA